MEHSRVPVGGTSAEAARGLRGQSPGTLRRRDSVWHRVRANRWSYAYIGPFLALVTIFTIYPIFASLGYTLYQWNGVGNPTQYVGLENFQRVVHDTIFWEAFGHTLVYTVVLVPIQLLLALALAMVLNDRSLRFSTFYRAVYFIPAVTSAAIIGVVFQLMLSNFGDAMGQLLIGLRLVRHQIDWLGDPQAVLWIVIAIGIWNTLGYNLVYFLAGLQTIPGELYEAARIDGAGAVGRFRHVTIPGLREVGVIILFLAILGSLQVFDLVQVLTGGGPYYASEVVNTYIYHQAFGAGGFAGGGGAAAQPNVGFASAASFFYGLLLLGITAAQALTWGWLRRRRSGQAR
ncbi:MAG TPA: sugar ABC transporter permease [Candidatus Dormibacteraeota bacterium]|nr:sugar ABC transporter permease [Candidatus Dormibacteraeota bacterium]